MRRLVKIIGLLTLAAGLLPVQAGALEKVVFSYSPTDALVAAYLAKDQGFFEKHGIDATIQMMSGTSTLIPAALMANSIQVGSGTFPIALLAIENGVDVQILASAIESAPGYHSAALIVRPDLEVKDAKDLEGKSIGVPGLNNSIHVLLVKWIADHGADPAKVHFVEAAVQQMPDLLRGRQLDAVTTVEPFTTRITQSGVGRLFNYFTDDMPSGLSSYIWMVSGSYAKAHPETMQDIRAALDDGLAYARAHPQSIEPVLEAYTHMPPDVLRNLPRPPYVNRVDPAQIPFWVDAMMKQKLLTKPIDAAALLVPYPRLDRGP